MRYAHILGATDFSDLGDLAIRSAAEIALASSARLTVVHVLPEPEAPSPLVPHYYDVHTDAERMKQAKEAAARALAERVPKEVADAGLEVHYDVRCGDPATEILAADVQLKPDLIVIATHGRQGLSRWLMGSVAARVMGHAHADVLTVRGRPPPE